MNFSKISFTLNGRSIEVQAAPFTRLLDLLREELELTGTKEGCGEGECGACSVFINGKLVNSCLVPVAQIQGAQVQSIEHLSPEVNEAERLHPVQKAFLQFGGAQCGICTPGMVMASLKLLEKHPEPSEEQIREGLAGNLCRCTGYMRIFDAVKEAAKMRREARP